jgi:hypothetical protein
MRLTINEVLSFLATKLLNFVPGFLLRVFFPTGKLARGIRIVLPGETPIKANLGPPVPHLDLWFQVTNHTPLSLTLDRLLADVWFGQPTFERPYLFRHVIAPHSTGKDFFIRVDLSSAQSAEVAKYIQASPPSVPIAVTVTGYFDTRVGPVEVKTRIERRKL